MIDFTVMRKGTKHFNGKIGLCLKCGRKGLISGLGRGVYRVCHKGEALFGGAGLAYRDHCEFKQQEKP